jgi:dihydrofolate reductase
MAGFEGRSSLRAWLYRVATNACLRLIARRPGGRKSDSLTPDQTEPWQETTRVIGRADAHEQIAALKRQPGKDILVFGSRTLWNDLLANELVDELHLMIGPVVVGAGTPIFDGRPAGTLRLIDLRSWDGSENVLVRYEVGRSEV